VVMVLMGVAVLRGLQVRWVGLDLAGVVAEVCHAELGVLGGAAIGWGSQVSGGVWGTA